MDSCAGRGRLAFFDRKTQYNITSFVPQAGTEVPFATYRDRGILVNINEFRSFCVKNLEGLEHQRESYLDFNLLRLYSIFRIADSIISGGGIKTLLSVGAGSAHVEAMLKNRFNLDVTIVDHKECILKNNENFRRNGFSCIGADITKPIPFGKDGAFDMVLSCDVVEHLLVSPKSHIAAFASRIRPGGRILLSTPNFARLGNTVALFRQRPIMAEPEKYFAEPCYENEGVHRREYVKTEITDALDKNGFVNEKTLFIWNNRVPALKRFILGTLHAFIPSVKPVMVFLGRKL
jgi:2-polyprenyl-3-methyl-5-hydroxy-6-metoxy-1,4-benzoquinol methylase